jgi:photosystem II stability/assembly factor-like uncharacterized protein
MMRLRNTVTEKTEWEFGMKHYGNQRLHPLLILMAVLVSSSVPPGISGGLDELAPTIELRGVPPPYSFKGHCALVSGEWWIVGGHGHIAYQSAFGELREQSFTTSDLLGVFFVDSITGWVVGTRGQIFATTDRGTNWFRQNSGVQKDLEAITCVNSTDCWIAAREGVLLHTVNGGQSWKRLDVGASEDLYALDFLSAKSGLVVGENGIVLRTQDGGRTWSSRHINLVLFPDGPFAATADLKAVRFVTDKIAWVAGSAGIAGTIDGGTTWSIRLKEKSFVGLASEGSEKGWAIGKAGVNFCTFDAGQHWRSCKVPN